MIELILKSYFSTLFLIAVACFFILSIGIYLIFKFNKREKALARKVIVPNMNVVDEAATATSEADIAAIAGDDLFATQLDLARAFIESGKKQFAKKILENILESGSADQRQEARLLLGQF
jgi:FimV-like protein